MTSAFKVDPQALENAALAFETQAKRLAVEIEVLSGLGIQPGGAVLQAGAGDLDARIGGKLDEIIEALAGAGERLQQTSTNLTVNAQNYLGTDGHVAGAMDAIGL